MPEAQGFAEEWAAAWNRRDVDAVLAHFHDDVVFTSPVAATRLRPLLPKKSSPRWAELGRPTISVC